MPRYLSITITAEVTEEGEAAIRESVARQLEQMRVVQERLGPLCASFNVPPPDTAGLTPENQALSMMVGLTWDALKSASVESRLPFDQSLLVYERVGFRIAMSAQRTGTPLPAALPTLISLSHEGKVKAMQAVADSVQVPM